MGEQRVSTQRAEGGWAASVGAVIGDVVGGNPPQLEGQEYGGSAPVSYC